MRTMNIRSFFVGIAALVLLGSANPDPYPDNYFRSPLGIPLYLAGGFAEMRSNHFHGGLDIKTQGKTGYRVYGAADGWVSRISISPSGYGNALYVSHPNGYMTVYGHLDSFRSDIKEFMKTLQYEKKSFAVEYFPSKNEFPVVQGEEIALSGNSGGSSGPHLHFEIRDERTGFPVNPLQWGFDIKDQTVPRIFRVKVYALDDNSLVRLHDKKSGGWVTVKGGDSATIDVTREGSTNVFSRIDKIEAAGDIAFSVQSHDYHEGSTNRLGLYTIQLTNNGKPLFKSSMDQFSFDQTRYINAHVDYAEFRKTGRWFQRSHVLPGNKLPLYQTVNRGVLTVRNQEKHSMQYEVTDAYGNNASLQFSVTGIEPQSTIVSASSRTLPYFDLSPEESFSFRAEGFALNLPAGAVYDVDHFSYKSEASTAQNVYSDIHVVHKSNVPMHSWAPMEIVPTRLPAELQDKAGIVRVSSNGSIAWMGGAYERGVVKTNIRGFDRFAVGVDTEKPTIRSLNMKANQNMTHSSQIRLRIADGLSGIASYSGRIDGKWVLFEYDSKNALIYYTFDGGIASGAHILDVEVVDQKNNKATLSLPFTR